MIDKNELVKYLNRGMSSREIEKKTGIKYWNILYYIKQYNLNELNVYEKVIYNDISYFNKIDTKEKAYILGFFLGDSGLSKEDKLDLRIKLEDIEVCNFIQSEIGCHITINNKINLNQNKFPSANIKIGNPNIIRDIKKLFGGRLKQDRHIPIISKSLERYLVQGFFDAEGCVTFGYRKDRNRLWQKISFTSKYKMLEGIQNILLKNEIPTKIKPKQQDDCFVMEFSDPKRVLLFLDYIYPNDSFIILNRKYEKANALRLELGEFGEN
jgi:hypothetical protein